MDNWQAGTGKGVGTHSGRVAAEIDAARRMMREGKSEAELALDAVTERMLNVIAANIPPDTDKSVRIDPGASDVLAPVVVRSQSSPPVPAK